MKRSLIAFSLVVLTSVAIPSARADDMGGMPGMSAGAINTNSDSFAVMSYATRGTVERIASDLRTATIDTVKIPGYMDAMIMDYPVLDTNELKRIVSGDLIKFTLVVSNNADWIEGIQFIGHFTTSAQTNAPQYPVTELAAGDLLPDGVLTSEDGREIHFSDFRGKALAFTFFYTRCPLPNYCPLMNRNFADARKLVSTMSNAPTNWEFLSISFDPGSDTPQVLATYGGYYRHGDSQRWLFASAPTNTLAMLATALDLMVFRDGETISHNLRTVVLDPHGRIYREFDGNEWTPADLASVVTQAAHQ
jgi:protein SCO1